MVSVSYWSHRSINLFAGHFNDREVVEDIKDIYGGSLISYRQLVFEVTERQPLEDLDTARKVMAEIRSLGCRKIGLSASLYRWF